MKNKSAVFTGIAGILMLSAVSCGPYTSMMTLEMRDASASGLDLSRKTMSVVYLHNGNAADSVFMSGVADGFAAGIQKEYYPDGMTVEIYSLSEDGKKWEDKENMLDLVMDTGTDVVFLFEKTGSGEFNYSASELVAVGKEKDIVRDSAYVTEFRVPFEMGLYVYDSMDKSDRVRFYSGKDIMKVSHYSAAPLDGDSGYLPENTPSDFYAPGAQAGSNSMSIFTAKWKSVDFTLIYFDGDSWYNALNHAYSFEWKKAMDIWIGMTGSSNLQKRSAAEYNLAVACYITGDKDLALKWLDRSDKDYPFYFSRSLRSIIKR